MLQSWDFPWPVIPMFGKEERGENRKGNLCVGIFCGICGCFQQWFSCQQLEGDTSLCSL